MTWPRSLVASIVVACGAVLAAPTDPDPTFGSAGVARISGAADLRSGALHPDGGLLVVVRDASPGLPGSRVLKLDSSGAQDAGFDPILAPPPNVAAGETATTVESAAILRDGRFVVMQTRIYPPFDVASIWRSYLTRHLADGNPDRSFGGGEPVHVSSGCLGTDLATDDTGAVFMPCYFQMQLFASSSIVRVGSSGSPIEALDLQSWPGDGLRWTHGRVALTRDLRPIAVANVTTGRGLGAVRLLGLSPDPSFGTGTWPHRGGLALAPTPEFVAGLDVALDADERVIVVGAGFRDDRTPFVVVARFTPDGRIDATFGEGGLTYAATSLAGGYFTRGRIALQADGRILIAANFEGRLADGSPFPRVLLVRLTSSGEPDASFASGGIAEFRSQRGSSLAFLAVRPNGRIVIGTTDVLPPVTGQPASEATIVQLLGGDLSPHTLRERRVVEYFHAGLGHYFVTASEQEMAALDTAADPAWIRTGRTFDAWEPGTALLQPVCRFWSDQSFAPKSSHFYTPYAHECELLKQGTTWRDEGEAFRLRLPEGTPGSRMCPATTQPLYRAYNNNLSGAPNHRYMSDPALLDQMIGQGWTMEGEVGTRVFACGPSRAASP